MSENKKILIITYYWPPSGGAGVQRWLKFSKYLPGYGWDPVILTVDPGFAEYPAIDYSLENDIPPEARVIKTRARNFFRPFSKPGNSIQSRKNISTEKKLGFGNKVARFIRGNFFIPDPRKGWNRYAIREAARLIEDENILHIITTSPPHSTQLVGLRLKKQFPHINWIADLRDPWTSIYYYDNFYPTIFARRIDSRLESRVLLRCDKLITVGQMLANHFIDKEASIKNKTGVLYNGYDEPDFKSITTQKEETFIITYVGALSDQYPIDGFIDAVSKIISEDKTELKLRFVGNVSKNWKILLAEKLGSFVEIIPYCEHQTAIQYIANSSLLLLVIPEHPGNKTIITGKLFEYLRSQRAILCLGPSDGEAADIIKKSKAGTTINYNDPVLIEKFIKEIESNPIIYRYPAKFSRKNIAKNLTDYL